MTRLKALDVMRGLTIALMILVNTALWGAPIFSPLKHSLWNGMTAADVVFPLFMFMMGVSMAFSLKKYDYRPGRSAVPKIVKRTVLIYLVGILLDSAEKAIAGSFSFEMLRFTGVLPRLALSYGFAAAFALCFSKRALKWIIGGLLVVYSAILLFFSGFEPTVENIVVKADLALFGERHIYHDWVPDGRIPLDPEGILGLIPSVAHVLIGYLCGRIVLSYGKTNLTPLLIVGAILTLSGLLLDAGIPINKKVWSPTFVLVSCGIGASLLGVLIYAIDVRKVGRWGVAEVFGANPLALYVLSSLIGCALWEICIGDESLPHFIYNAWLLPLFGAESAWPSLIYALSVTGLCYLVGRILYARKIYIKM